MGIVHPGSTLTPTKDELLADWAPAQPWWPGGDVPPFVANFRFDDPTGEVGIETLLLPVDGRIVQAPLTYRSAPLESGALVGELHHSALGRRWVYDGLSDPVYLAETAAVIREGRGEVSLTDSSGAELPRRPFTASVRGSGTGQGELTVPRLLPADVPADASGTLTGAWAEQPDPVVLAWLS